MHDDMNLYPVCLLPDRREDRRRNDEDQDTELRVLSEARGLLYQGKVDQALSGLETLFLPSGLWTGLSTTSVDGSCRREAALLKAWCLIGQKQHSEAERWLETAYRNGHLPQDDPGARVIILNKMLCEEKHKEVQLEAEDLLEKITDPADRNHAELRMVLGAALRWQGKLDAAVGHLEFACSAFTVMDIAIVLFLSFVLTMVVGFVYRYTHRGVSYSQSYVHTLVIMGCVIAVIMLIIGSNIARAFALVGALSIVRFRNAMKETRDIGFIFMAMAIGMAVGTRFYLLAIFSAVALCAFTVVLYKLNMFKKIVRERILRVQLPVDRDHEQALDEPFHKHLDEYRIISASLRKCKRVSHTSEVGILI